MNFFLHLIVLISVFVPNVLGYNIIFGKGRILHFGPIGISIPTVYAIVLTLVHTQNFALAFLAGLLAAVVVSTCFFWLSLRLDSDAFGVMSIAMHLSLLAVVLNWNSVTRGALGIPKIPRLPFLDSVADFAIFGTIMTAASIIAVWLIDKSSFGRKLASLAEHEWHATSLGIDKKKTHFMAFMIGAIGITTVNFIYPQYLTILHPNDFQFPALVFFITLVIAGNPGSVKGVTISTVVLVLLREALRFVPLAPSVLGPIRLMLFGLILLAAVWWRRDSLFPHKRSI